MSIQVEVRDPDGEIDDISLVYSSTQCVLLLIELSAIGKNHGITSSDDDWFLFQNASLRVTGLPFENYHWSPSTVRYTCFLTLIASEAVDDAELLYSSRPSVDVES